MEKFQKKRGFMPQNKLKGGSEAPCLPFSPMFPGLWSLEARMLQCSGLLTQKSPGLSDASISGASPSPEGRGEKKGNRAHKSDLYDLLAALVKGFGAKRLKLMTTVSFMY